MSTCEPLSKTAGCQVNKKQSQVSEEMDYLENQISLLSENADLVSDALQNILRNEDPAPVRGEGIAGDAIVPLAARIRANRMKTQEINERLLSILGRIEVQ